MNKNDCLSPEKLILYSDGSLPKDELKEVEEHVKNCPSCKEEVDYLKHVFTKIEVASVCPSVDELIEYDPEGEGKRDTFIRSHIKYCSKCNDILNRLSCAVEQFEEPAKDIKTAKLPEKVSKEIERYYPEQKKMSFWQFLSTFFFSKKTIAVFSSIFVILCCLLIFKLTFVPQMIDDKKMSSMNEKIKTESKINTKEVDSATYDSINIVDTKQKQNDDDIIDEILSSVVTEDEQDKIEKNDKKEINSESNKNNIEDINKQTEQQIENFSNKNSNDINLNDEDDMAELPNNIADNKLKNINENSFENVLEESNESEEMGQLRREYMQGAEVEIHELEDKTAKVSAPKSEPPKTVEKPVKRYVIPIKPVDSVNRETIKLNSYSDSLSKNSSSDRVSKKVAEYRKDTSSDNELYKQLRKKLIKDKDREESKESEEKNLANIQSVLPAKTSVVQKVSNSQPEKKSIITIPKTSSKMESEAPPMSQPMLGQPAGTIPTTNNVVGSAPNNNAIVISKSVSRGESKLSISPLALEYKINMEIGYGSITITSVTEDGSVYYEIKQNRTLTDDDLAVINKICAEYRDIKIRFK